MHKRSSWLSLAAGVASLVFTSAAYAAPTKFSDAAMPPNPAKTAVSRPDPVSPPSKPVGGGDRGTLTIYTVRALFEADFPGLPQETFEEGNAPGGGFSVCDSPLDSAGDAPCGFAAGEINEGAAYQDNPGPDAASLILLGPGTSLNPSMAVVANTFAEAFDIVFDPPVSAAGMDLISTTGLGVGNPDTLTITVFDAGGGLIGTDASAAASGPGNFWGVSSTTPIGRISMLSQNAAAEGVDNIAYAGDPALVVSDTVVVDACSTNPANVNGVIEPGESFTIDIELTAVAGGFTNISGTLSTSSPGVTIISGASTWPNLASGASAFSNSPFVVSLAESATCGEVVDLDLTLTATEGGGGGSVTLNIGQALEPDVPVAIPDNNPAGASSDLIVADNVVLTDVNVRVQITHTWVGDLIISLRAPNNATVVLLDRPGVPVSSTVGCLDNDMDVTFDDANATDLEAHCAGTTPWFSGTANPVGSLSDFNGLSSAGTWSLLVSDNAGSDTGTIVDWELITTPAVSGVCTVCVGNTTGGGGETSFDIEVPTIDRLGMLLMFLGLASSAVFLIRRR